MVLKTGSRGIVVNFNPNHDELGRFAEADSAGDVAEDGSRAMATGSATIQAAVRTGAPPNRVHTIWHGEKDEQGRWKWTVLGRRAQLGNAQRDAKVIAKEKGVDFGGSQVIAIGTPHQIPGPNAHSFNWVGVRRELGSHSDGANQGFITNPQPPEQEDGRQQQEGTGVDPTDHVARSQYHDRKADEYTEKKKQAIARGDPDAAELYGKAAANHAVAAGAHRMADRELRSGHNEHIMGLTYRDLSAQAIADSEGADKFDKSVRAEEEMDEADRRHEEALRQRRVKEEEERAQAKKSGQVARSMMMETQRHLSQIRVDNAIHEGDPTVVAGEADRERERVRASHTDSWTETVMGKMPDRMANAAARNFGGVQRRTSGVGLAEEFNKKYRTNYRSLGGWYEQGAGRMKIECANDVSPEVAQGIIAHEMGHAVDYDARHTSKPARFENGKYIPAQILHSEDKAWRSAWRKEIKTDDERLVQYFGGREGREKQVRLSLYAKTNPSEGFAEYAQLIVQDPAKAESKFPKCWAFWKSKGLL